MTNDVEYRGFTVYPVFQGWKVKDAKGVSWVEKYANLADAKASINFELKKERV